MSSFFAFTNLLQLVLPALFSAMHTVQADTGKPWDQVAVDVINHLTPGQPNAAALEAGKPAAPST